MTKKKNKQKKGGGKGVFGNNIGNVGTALVSILVGAIVENAVRQILKKASGNSHNHKDKGDGKSIEDLIKESTGDTSNSVKTATSQLQENLGDAQITVKDAIEAIRTTVDEYKPNWEDLLEQIKGLAVRSTPLSLLGDNADLAIEGIANKAKNAFEASDSNKKNKSDRKDKKKKKEKKKNN